MAKVVENTEQVGTDRVQLSFGITKDQADKLRDIRFELRADRAADVYRQAIAEFIERHESGKVTAEAKA